VHPLLVIFALLAGAQIGGILGMIAALPILAMLKHTFSFYEFRFSRAAWAGDDGAVLVRTAAESPPLPMAASPKVTSAGAGRRRKVAGKPQEPEKSDPPAGDA
jgi:hypothetical protein